MNLIKYIAAVWLLTACVHDHSFAHSGLFPESILTGKITDAITGTPLPGATIYITDLKKGTISDRDGNYTITNLPATRLRIQVSSVGYKMIIKVVDLSTTTTMDFTLQESVAELNEVVVTGLSLAGEKNRTPTPITVMPSMQLQQITSTNLIDAVATQPGISQVTTGASISKPVIRGLGFNRVVVVNDGIRQEGQQWGDEHGIEVDEFSVDRVEILKGPASLMYGSDAMAGVINFLNAPTLPEGTIEGKMLTNYQTNNGLFAYSLNLAGNNNDVIWNLRWSRKWAHAYRNSFDGFVLNSGFSENSISGIVGLNKPWGYSHLHISSFSVEPGIAEGDRDSLTGKFIKPVALNGSSETYVIAGNDDFKSYSNFVPYQIVNHYKAVLLNNFIVGAGNLKVILGAQQNRRKEFGDIFSPDTYGLYFLLNTINYDLKYVFPGIKGWDLTAGINGMYQQSENKGSEYLVPEYNLFDAGVYLITRKSLGKLDLSGGLRYDSRKENGKELFLDENGNAVSPTHAEAENKFQSFDASFNGFSGSLGATYQLSEVVYTKFNASRGFRAPNIAELGSNGEHEGSGRYEIGNANLKAENSLQLDFAFGINTDHITGELNLFTNTINNFIFISRLNTTAGADSVIGESPVFGFTSEKANLTGGEISIDIHPHPLDWLHLENSFSYVEGIRSGQPDSVKYLPYIPAPRLSSEIKADVKKIIPGFINAYMKIGMDYYFRQDKIYTVNNTETPTDGYALFNLGAGGEVSIKNKTIALVNVSINNLFDTGYQNHLSRLKYAPENYVTGRTGVFGMGRNFSIKLIVPFKLKKNVKVKE